MSAQTIQQLESARSLALGDGRYYPTIIPGVLPIIGYSADNQSVDIQRWGADFLAEAFASPTWPPDAKQTSASSVLPTLRDYLDHVDDKSVIKSAVQAAASVYPLVYRHIVSHPNDAQEWQTMSSIKTNILRRMDAATPGVRICCVKFLQQVVLVQTPGVVDPRRPDHSDISLALVPRDHPLIPYASLEAEGHGLLDRLLDIIHGDHSDGLLVTATLNSLGMLIQRRPAIANKILSSVLNFNPLKLANSPITPKNKVIIKSIERTTRALLVNVMKRNPGEQISGRLQQFLERMQRARHEAFDESNRKRPAPSEPTDGLDHTKRQRVTAEVVNRPSSVPPLPSGPVSWRDLYTLNPSGSTVNFDVQAFKDPEQLLRILVPVLQSVDAQKLDHSINIVRSRYLSLSQAAAARPRATQQASAPAAEDEEEYEPDFEPEDTEQIVNRLDGLPATDLPDRSGPSAPLAPYKLPEAPPLSEREVEKYGDQTVHRAFGMLSSVDENPRNRNTKSGFNRLAATDYGRDAWVTILSRLATRANAGLEDPDGGVKDEYAVRNTKGSVAIGEAVRDGLYNYIIQDWKKRIDVAISWLNEEWYNDTVLAKTSKMNGAANGYSSHDSSAKGNYQRCALRMFDGILGYVEHTDKILLRFLSEIPALDHEILSRLKDMARDPERIDLACTSLQYLYMFRPPVRTTVVDVLAEMWQENERARPSARKLLARWRPEVVAEDGSGTPAMKGESDGQPVKESANGVLEVKAAS